MNTSIISETFLNDLLTYFQAQCLTGLHNLLPEAIFLVWTLGIILLCLRTITEGHIFGSGSWQSYILTVLKIGVFVFLVMNWEDISINIIFKSFEVAGQTAGNYSQSVMPSGILMTGFALTQLIFDNILRGSIMGAIVVTLLKLLMCLIILALFAYMAVMFFLVTIEFYLTAALSVILIPFGMISYLKFLFDNVISAMFNFGVKYMTMTFILGLGVTLFASWGTSLDGGTQWQDIAKAAVGVAVYCLMVVKIPDLVSGMITGSPSYDSGTQMATGTAAGVGLSAGRMIGRGGGTMWRGTNSQRQQAWNTVRQGGRSAFARVSGYTTQTLANIRRKYMGY